jgi:hypothetical protein
MGIVDLGINAYHDGSAVDTGCRMSQGIRGTEEQGLPADALVNDTGRVGEHGKDQSEAAVHPSRIQVEYEGPDQLLVTPHHPGPFPFPAPTQLDYLR